MRTLLLLLPLLALPACAHQTSPLADASSNNHAVVSSLTAWHQASIETGFSGLALIAEGEQVLLQQAYGLADYEQQRPFTTDTVFDTGSVTKQFTAAAILRLQQQGLLSVQDTLAQFFSDVPADKAGISLHQLLTHSGGLIGDLRGGDYSPKTRQDFLRQLFASRLQSTPGSQFAYSNAGYGLLGLIIEQVSGQSYESYLQQWLFQPAGMQHTGYVLPKWPAEQLAVGYYQDRRWFQRIRHGLSKSELPARRWGNPLDHSWADDGPWWNLHANGGLLSTLGDLYLWYQALQSDKVLSDEQRGLLFAPHQATTRPGLYYGYGWLIDNSTPEHGIVIRHGGSNGLFTMDFRIHQPAEQPLLLLWMTNYSDQYFSQNRDALLHAVQSRIEEHQAK
ncbi:serine hydrolase domain-containing protein [Alkalimonas amylolytica]|uniref:CubicO group peptidase, beta-lactamase class C family n=1 Tax=Alkalimonas amylolytica TaxID=152573 RepID=A0A1H4FUL9_ALKAM|nr:serine hydrolase domain-containing protein [Alkalimonas amylolytica]SEB01026.1 CubicO group peptidase, beta-lactamase class C family [Alkalimonas amylolytica]